MAARDIMPWISPLGGTYEVRWNQMTSGELFEVGEPVGVVNAGTLTEPPDDGTEWLLADMDTTGNICGIAAYGPGAGNIDPATGAAMAALADVPFWPADQGTLFITENFWPTGGDSAAGVVVPLQTDVGEIYQITYDSTTALQWGIEQTAGTRGTDVCAVIHEVLDANFAPIRISGGTGVYLVFEIQTNQ